MTIPRAKAPSGAGIVAAGTNPWLIAIIVSVATFMEVLDTTIANVALRYISGGLQQQASLLSYIDVFVVLGVIAAVIVPLALSLRSVKAGKERQPAA
jgi:MFS transporter, DHA2 family, multidrug resistance protein